MAISKEKFISDVELQLNQGSITDDSALEQTQIAQWGNVHLNDLIRKEIIFEQSKGNPIPPVYIVREIDLTITEENVTDIAAVKQRMYVTLAQDVLDLPRDGGVIRVLDYDLNLIRKTSLENLEDLRNLRFSKPSTENVVHYREGKKVFLEGFNTADVDFNPIIVDYIPKQDILELADEDEILITDQLLPLLIAAVVQTGKLQMYGTQPDEASDSTDTKKTAYHLAINNPNSPAPAQPQPEQ